MIDLDIKVRISVLKAKSLVLEIVKINNDDIYIEIDLKE